MRRFALTTAVFAVLAVPAWGDGLPVTGTDAGPAGVTTRGAAARYVTAGRTLLAIQRRGGRLIAVRRLDRPLAVSTVAYDGSPTGLSADGRTLVLAQPRDTFLRRRSTFAVFAADGLRPRASFTLRGDFSLDAVSPDGRRLYFIQLRSSSEYAVRAFDLPARRLLPKPVVDPAEADEPMQGLPVTRALSRDGRWAYTLYDRGGEPPFIHALDTTAGRARCIDLDMLAGRTDISDMRLRVTDDGTIVARNAGESVVVVDPRTFAVTEPRLAQRSESSAPGGGWLAPVGGVALLALLGAAVVRSR